MVTEPGQAKGPVFSIVISEKGGAERREAFQQSELSIGRVQGNDLMLAKGNVSKRHARLVFRDGRFIVTDLNSTNGTYVNRRRINQATIVRQGDRIYIGDFVIRIEVPSEDSSTLDRASVKPSGPREPLVTAADISQVSLSPARDPLDSTGRYPSVPPAPRIPTGASVDPVPSSSGRASDRSSASGREDSISSEVVSYRNALSALVERIAGRIDLRALDRDIPEATVGAVRRAINDELETLRRDGIIEAAVVDERLKRDVAAELLELGPVGPLFEDDSVSEIAIAGTHSVVTVRNGQRSVVEPALSSEASVRRVLARLCRMAGAPPGNDETVVKRSLPNGFSLVAVCGEGASGGTLIRLERPARIDVTLDDLVRAGTISRAIATFLKHCVSARANILVIGPPEARTSSMLSALATASTSRHVVAVRRHAYFAGGSVTHLEAERIEADPSAVLSNIARMPDVRLFVEQFAGGVALATLEAVASGAQGVVAALPAPSIAHGLSRAPAEIASLRAGLTTAVAREWLATTFDVFVEVASLRDGRHRVLRVAEPAATEGPEIQTRDIFTFVVERTATGGLVEGTFQPTGSQPRLVEDMTARGISVDSGLFSRPPSR